MNLASHRVTQMSNVHESYICIRFCFITICIETTLKFVAIFLFFIYLLLVRLWHARLSWSCVPDLQVRAQRFVCFVIWFDYKSGFRCQNWMYAKNFIFFLSFFSSLFTFCLLNFTSMVKSPRHSNVRIHFVTGSLNMW